VGNPAPHLSRTDNPDTFDAHFRCPVWNFDLPLFSFAGGGISVFLPELSNRFRPDDPRQNVYSASAFEAWK
jgi:hypothetical protein